MSRYDCITASELTRQPGVNDLLDVARRTAAVDRLWASPADPETDALKTCADALSPLDIDQQRRVLTYLEDRFIYTGKPSVFCGLCRWTATAVSPVEPTVLPETLEHHLLTVHADDAVVLDQTQRTTHGGRATEEPE